MLNSFNTAIIAEYIKHFKPILLNLLNIVWVAQNRRGVFVFYDNFLILCKKKGISPSRAVMDMGMNRSIATFWKNGTVPKMDTLTRIADYFEVPVGFLVDGNDTEKKAPTLEGEQDIELTPAFFRLKQGLEPYDISDSDVDFLLDVYKAHIKKNQ